MYKRFLLLCTVVVLFSSALCCAQERTDAREGNSYYIAPLEDTYTSFFSFDVPLQPRSSAPVIFLIDSSVSPSRISAVINNLRSYSHLWVPDSTYQYGNQFLCTRGTVQEYQSWNIARYAITWTDSQTSAQADIYQSLILKKQFIKSPLDELNSILGKWAASEYSYQYDQFKTVLLKMRNTGIPVEQFLFNIFALADNAQVSLEPYPILSLYRNAFLQVHTTRGMAPYAFNRIESEQEAFHARLSQLSEDLSHEDIDFLLETVVAKKMVFSSYKRFMSLMKTAGIDCIAEYPAFHYRLYTMAWHDKLKTPQVQDELRALIKELDEKLRPVRRHLLIEQWNEYARTLSRFIKGAITIDDYRLLSTTPSFEQSGPMDGTTKTVITQIKEVWTDVVQKKVAAAIRTFFNYTQLYFDENKALGNAMNDAQADIVFIVADESDMPAWIFWLSSMNTGTIVHMYPKMPQPEGDNNYFKLMRGERSPFEKLLEGFGGEQ